MYPMAFSSTTAVLALLISVLSAYRVVDCLVGERLTRFHACVTSTLYVMSVATVSGAVVQTSMDMQVAREQGAMRIPEVAI